VSLNSYVDCVQAKLRGKNIFRPHSGYRTKTKYCMRCEMYVDLDKEQEAAREETDKHKKVMGEERSKRHTVDAVERSNNMEIREKTGDPSYGTAESNVKSQPTMMDVERKTKDGAVKAAAALPKQAREMVMAIIQNTVSPTAPMVPIPNPAWSKTMHKKVPRYIMVRVHDPSKGRNKMKEKKNLPKNLHKDPNIPEGSAEPQDNQKKVEEALKAPEKIQAQQIARKAIRIAEAYARNANAIMQDKPPVTPKDLKVVDLSNKESKTFLCTHDSVPVDCCTCCKTMSKHCCQFCEEEKAQKRQNKAIETGKEDNNEAPKERQDNHKQQEKKDEMKSETKDGMSKNNKTPSKSKYNNPIASEPEEKSSAKSKNNNSKDKNMKSPSSSNGQSKSTSQSAEKSSSSTSKSSLSPSKSKRNNPTASKLQEKPSSRKNLPSTSSPSSSPVAPTSSETNVPSIAERMGVLPSPFKHSGKGVENNDNNEDVNSKKKNKIGKPIALPTRSKKTGFTKNAEEVECEKQWEMSRTDISRHQDTESKFEGGVAPISNGCVHRNKRDEDAKVEKDDSKDVVDIFPTKVNLAKACSGEGSRGAAACLTAQAAVRAKMAALDAVKAAKEGDVAGATEALRNAAMGKSGRAGKSVAEKQREKEEQSNNNDKTAKEQDAEAEKQREKEEQSNNNDKTAKEQDAEAEKPEETPPPPDKSSGIDKTPAHVPKLQKPPVPKEDNGPFDGKFGAPSADDQGKHMRGDFIDKNIRLTAKEKEPYEGKTEQDVKDEQKFGGTPYQTFLQLMEHWEIPTPPIITFAEFMEKWDQPPVPNIGDTLDKREDSLDPAEQIRQENEKKAPFKHQEQYAKGEGPKAGTNDPGLRANEDEEPEGSAFKLGDMTVCINESSEGLARELLSKLIVDAKTKFVCTPARSNKYYNTLDRWKFEGGR
jgi:hypothetical protein